jgi:hypothetical protein
MKKPAEVDEIPAQAAKLSPEEEELGAYFSTLKRESLKSLEDGARQLIGLVTTLTGVFFGVLALRGAAPAGLTLAWVKLFGALALLSYFAALAFALKVVLPRRLDAPNHDLRAMRALLDDLFEYKSQALRLAQQAFSLATFFLLAVTLFLLFQL